ncbi:hypothetical protein [Paenibacillus sp. GCM10027626]
MSGLWEAVDSWWTSVSAERSGHERTVDPLSVNKTAGTLALRP